MTTSPEGGPRPPSRSAIFAAAVAWNAATLRRLLVAAPQLAVASDARGRTALHRACAVPPGTAGLGEPHGLRTIAVLLAAGAALEAEAPMPADEGDFRATALWFAVARGVNLPLTRLLLRRGADASWCLWAAVWRDDAPFMRALLRSRPRLDLTAHGETPLFYAARLRRLATLRLLLAAGADPSIADPQGRDAVAIARARRLSPALIARLEAARDRLAAGKAAQPPSAASRSTRRLPPGRGS